MHKSPLKPERMREKQADVYTPAHITHIEQSYEITLSQKHRKNVTKSQRTNHYSGGRAS